MCVHSNSRKDTFRLNDLVDRTHISFRRISSGFQFFWFCFYRFIESIESIQSLEDHKEIEPGCCVRMEEAKRRSDDIDDLEWCWWWLIWRYFGRGFDHA